MSVNSVKGTLKCRRCSVCMGYGCIAQLPGLGGVFNNKNFQLNCSAWKKLEKNAEADGKLEEIKNIEFSPAQIMCAPVTGSCENIGYANEQDFYFPYFNESRKLGFGVCAGDGFPDEKIKFGIAAVKKIREEIQPDFQAAFFFKPYPDEKLFERLEWTENLASHIGIDIDAYNIITMRNKVNLEQKTAGQINELRKKSGLPFVIKGVFTQKNLELVKECKPEVALVSNHGGRVETDEGSSADFLVNYGSLLKDYCGEIWVDGGIRSKLDVQTALYYGASKVLVCRPIITAVFDDETAKLSATFL